MRVVHHRPLFIGQIGIAGALSVLQQRFDFCNSAHCNRRLFLHILTHTGCLIRPFRPLFQRGEIGKREFNIDGFDIRGGIDFVIYVNDVGIIKAAHDMCNNAHLADMGKELIAESFTL